MRSGQAGKWLGLSIGALLLVCGLSSVAAAGEKAKTQEILLGFVQVSAEGTWRVANSHSIKTSAEEAGIQLLFKEGQNNYSNQVNELRELIATGVDVLAYSPSQVDGWDEVLKEAKRANIPVVVVDRAIHTKDESLFVTHIGSDMVEEGRRAARWLVAFMTKNGKGKGQVRIAVLEGVKGSTPAVHRGQGFREVLQAHPNYQIVASQPADYMFSKGEDVMMGFLDARKGDIDVVFAHNDEMALGAVEAVRKYGKIPGKDVVIIGVDAIKKALEAVAKGELNATIECSPLLGPQLMSVVKDIVSGKSIPRRVITLEKDYDASNAAAEIPKRVY